MRSNSAITDPMSYPPLKLGLCTNEADEQALHDAGFDPVWRIGNQKEGLKPLLGYPRGRYTVIGVAEDLRIIGDSRKAIFAKVRELKAANINFLNIRTNCSDELVLIELAQVAISKQAGMKNHRTARRRGRKGGEAKRVAAEDKRNAVMHSDAVWRFVHESGLSLKRLAYLLGPPYNPAALSRHFKQKI